MDLVKSKRYPAYRDGVAMWTEGEVLTAPDGEIVEILYPEETTDKVCYFVELPGVPACAHGDTLQEAIDAAREKRDGQKPLTEEEKKKYRVENFKFSVALFRRITGACNAGIRSWLKERNLDSSLTMTLKEFKEAGGGEWANKLESKLT